MSRDIAYVVWNLALLALRVLRTLRCVMLETGLYPAYSVHRVPEKVSRNICVISSVNSADSDKIRHTAGWMNVPQRNVNVFGLTWTASPLVKFKWCILRELFRCPCLRGIVVHPQMNWWMAPARHAKEVGFNRRDLFGRRMLRWDSWWYLST